MSCYVASGLRLVVTCVSIWDMFLQKRGYRDYYSSPRLIWAVLRLRPQGDGRHTSHKATPSTFPGSAGP